MIFSINWPCSRQSWRLFGLFGLMLLVGCGRSLDLKATEKTLKEELVKQGVGSLKQVSCSEEMKAGQKFECIGIFESGIGFKIPVEHKSEGDKLTWEIPSIKGMLNMNQVMKAIQSEMKVSEGSLDCGTSTTYRMATLGSRFECTVVLEKLDAKAKQDAKPDAKPDLKLDAKPLGELPDGKGIAKAVKEPDKVEITIASSGDVTWQRLVVGDPKKVGPIAGADPSDNASEAAKTDTKTESGDKAESKPKEDSKAKSGKASTADKEEVPYDS